MSERPRALFVAPIEPSETGNGLAMRCGVFFEALCRIADTELAVLPVAGRIDVPPLAAKLGVRSTTLEIAGREDTHFGMLSLLRDADERLAAFRSYGRPSLEARVGGGVLADLRDKFAGRYDLIHVERSYLGEAGLALADRTSLVTIDLDENDAAAQRGFAALASTGGRERAWAEAEAAAFDALLDRLAPRTAMSFVSSALERTELAAAHPGLEPIVVENAVRFPELAARRDDGRTLLFIGSFGYGPNRDGMAWFFEAVWPLLQGHGLRLLIAGHGLRPDTLEVPDDEAITLLGAVAAPETAYALATVAIAPLRVGGGTRIKLIEAAAQGVAIVASTAAARGLAFADKDSMWLADDAAGFAQAVLDAVSGPAERQRRAGNALARARIAHDRAGIVERIGRHFEQAIMGTY